MVDKLTTSEVLLQYPFALHAKIARSTKINRNDVLDALQQARRIYDEAIRLNNLVYDLKYEIQNLKAENNFMLKLINEQ